MEEPASVGRWLRRKQKRNTPPKTNETYVAKNSTACISLQFPAWKPLQTQAETRLESGIDREQPGCVWGEDGRAPPLCLKFRYLWIRLGASLSRLLHRTPPSTFPNPFTGTSTELYRLLHSLQFCQQGFQPLVRWDLPISLAAQNQVWFDGAIRSKEYTNIQSPSYCRTFVRPAWKTYPTNPNLAMSLSVHELANSSASRACFTLTRPQNQLDRLQSDWPGRAGSAARSNRAFSSCRVRVAPEETAVASTCAQKLQLK